MGEMPSYTEVSAASFSKNNEFICLVKQDRKINSFLIADRTFSKTSIHDKIKSLPSRTKNEEKIKMFEEDLEILISKTETIVESSGDEIEYEIEEFLNNPGKSEEPKKSKRFFKNLNKS